MANFIFRILPLQKVSLRCIHSTKVLNNLVVTCSGETRRTQAVVVGVYDDDLECQDPRFTEAGCRYNEITCGRLEDLLKISGPIPTRGEYRIFYDLDTFFNSVAVVGLGKACDGYDDYEERDEGKEAIRVGTALGCRALQDLQIHTIHVDSCGHAESAAEGASLGIWVYQELKNKNDHIYIPHLELYCNDDYTGWHIGMQKAAAQNLARQLQETPANLLTPTTFAQNAVDVLCNSGVNVEVKVKGWAETQKMGAFLSVAKGSCEPPIFLELSYYGTHYSERPIVLIGSGVTFDSGGLCLKPKEEMVNMRGDMQGAAAVVATARAIAALRLPINIRGLIPLCENMPGCSAMKPGDIVTAMNGKNILIQDTNCDGRLIMADALYYAQAFWPRFVVDVGSLTVDIRRALGTSSTGAFTNSDCLWHLIHNAGIHTGDRVWRMPLWNFYSNQVLKSRSADVKSMGYAFGGGASRAAAFLREFVDCGEWLHLDTYGVMKATGKEQVYLRKGMSGRPTRTLVEFISQLSCKKCE